MNVLLVLATFLISLGLTARLSHFVVDDAITQPIRNWILSSAHKGVSYESGKPQGVTPLNQVFRVLTALTECIHCVSVWSALAVTALSVRATDLHLSWFFFAGWVATLSYLTGIVASLRYKWEAQSTLV